MSAITENIMKRPVYRSWSSTFLER